MTEAPAPAPTAAPAAVGRRAPSLLRHVALLVAVLGGLLLLLDVDSSWTSDDGAYAVQAELLRETGEWEYPTRHPEADPGNRATPIAHSTLTEDGRALPYAKHPAWTWVQVASSSWLGEVVGLHLPGLAGVVAAAVAAWYLARQLDRPDLAPWSFWAVGVGPLLVSSTALWAHSVAAAGGGLFAIHVVREARRRPHVVLRVVVPLVALALPLVRSEATLLAIGAAAALAGAGWQAGGPPARRAVRAAALAGPVGLAGVAGRLANSRWIATVVDGTQLDDLDASPRPASFVAGRVDGALRTFVDGAGSSAGSTVLGLMTVALAVAAGVALRRGDRRPALVLGALALAALVGRAVEWGEADLAGLLVAAPLLAVGIASIHRTRIRALAPLLVLVGGTWALTVATQYAEGGGREWGGRYALAAIVPATVVAVVALADAWRASAPVGQPPTDPAPRGRGRGTVLAGCALALPSLVGLVVTQQVAASARADTELLVAEGDATVVVTAAFVPRMGWRHLPEADWLIGREDDVAPLLAALRTTVDGRVVVRGPGAGGLDPPGYRTLVREDARLVLEPTDP